MSLEYEEFKKIIYKDMIHEWNNIKLSYHIQKHTIDSIINKTPMLTTEKIMEDFRKYPLIKEVFMSLGRIVVLPH